MLVNWHDPDHIYLVCGKTDMRKGIDGLAMVIVENYGLGVHTGYKMLENTDLKLSVFQHFFILVSY